MSVISLRIWIREMSKYEYAVTTKPEHTGKIYATKHETKFADMGWSIESLILFSFIAECAILYMMPSLIPQAIITTALAFVVTFIVLKVGG